MSRRLLRYDLTKLTPETHAAICADIDASFAKHLGEAPPTRTKYAGDPPTKIADAHEFIVNEYKLQPVDLFASMTEFRGVFIRGQRENSRRAENVLRRMFERQFDTAVRKLGVTESRCRPTKFEFTAPPRGSLYAYRVKVTACAGDTTIERTFRVSSVKGLREAANTLADAAAKVLS